MSKYQELIASLKRASVFNSWKRLYLAKIFPNFCNASHQETAHLLNSSNYNNCSNRAKLTVINNTSRNQRAIQFLPFLGPHPNIIPGPVFGGQVTTDLPPLVVPLSKVGPWAYGLRYGVYEKVICNQKSEKIEYFNVTNPNIKVSYLRTRRGEKE